MRHDLTLPPVEVAPLPATVPPEVQPAPAPVVVDAATFDEQARRPARRTQHPGLGRVVLVLVDPSINNGSDTAPATVTRVWQVDDDKAVVNVRLLLDAAPSGVEWATSRFLWPDEDTARSQGSEIPPGGVSVHAFWPALVGSPAGQAGSVPSPSPA